jgi:hypothetical protein
MRKVIVILAIVGILFLGVLGLGRNAEEPSNADEFDGGELAAFIDSLPLPGRPRIRIAREPFVVRPLSGGLRFHIGTSDAATRVVTLGLLSGSAAVAKYECAGDNCSAELCLVRQGVSAPGGCRPGSKATGSLVIAREGGTVIVDAIDPGGVRVESR